MATLLSMVNDLRGLLREETVDDIYDTDEYTQTLIPIINKSASYILESRRWSFDKRHDGTIVFNAPIEFDAVGILANATSFSFFGTVLQNNVLVSQPTRMIVSNDPTSPNTSYRILTSAPAFGTITVGLGHAFPATAVPSASIKLFANEKRLPATVRHVLSVRHEETPVRLVEVERDLEYDSFLPRDFDAFQPIPDVVYTGGTVTDTYNTDYYESGETGMGMMIWPPPSERVVLHYSYVYRHPKMSAATDTLIGVPDSIISLIVDRSFYYCLTSNVEADKDRAAEVRRQLNTDMGISVLADRPAVNRRRIMRPVCAGSGVHPNARWSSREVPSP